MEDIEKMKMVLICGFMLVTLLSLLKIRDNCNNDMSKLQGVIGLIIASVVILSLGGVDGMVSLTASIVIGVMYSEYISGKT